MIKVKVNYINKTTRTVYQDGVGVFARHPLICRESWCVTDCVRIEVVLVEDRLSWHRKRNDLTESTSVQFVETCNLILVHIEAPLGHPPDATLRIGGCHGVDEEYVGVVVCHLKVPHGRVTLHKNDILTF